MDVDDVVSSLAKHAPEIAAKMPAQRDAGLRSVGVDWLAPTEPNDVRLLLGPRNVRRDDVDVVAAPAGFPGKEVDVLADAAEVRVVVLGDQRDTQRPLVARELERR
jgi:hypothetical protein